MADNLSWDDHVTELIAQSQNAAGISQIEAACIFSLTTGALFNSDQCPHLLHLEPDERRFIAKEIRKQRLNKFERGIQLGNDTFYLEHAGRKLIISTKDKRRAMVLRYTDKAVVAAYTILDRDQSVVNAAIKSVTKAINQWEHTAVAKEDRADLNRTWNEVTWSIETSQLPNIST